MVRIQSLYVICTPDSTTVSSTLAPLSGPHLLITAQARADGTGVESISVVYYDHDATPSRIHASVADAEIFHALTSYMKGTGATIAAKCDSYMNQLPRDDVSVIVREYGTYFQEGRILDGFIAGIASYVSLLLLLEHGAFISRMPFQFSVPTTVKSGHAVTGNMLSHMALPLTALAKITTGVLGQIVSFVQTFINMWDTAFVPGPEIGSKNETRMCLEIITGMTQHTTEALAQIERDRQAITTLIEKLGADLRKDMAVQVTLFRRELSNINAEARASVTEVSEQLHTLQSSFTPGQRLDAVERRIEVLNRTLLGEAPKQEHNPFDVRKRTGPLPYVAKRHT